MSALVRILTPVPAEIRRCEMWGCSRQHHALGRCRAHYDAQRPGRGGGVAWSLEDGYGLPGEPCLDTCCAQTGDNPVEKFAAPPRLRIVT